MKNAGLLFLLLFCFVFSSLAADYTNKSVLSEGKWVQLKVTENAVYQLTYDDIKKMGFSDPAKIKIYGYGGWILDQDFKKPYMDDLPEVAVFVNKGNDGVFNSGDYLLFYGRGLRKWTYNGSFFEHENNPYSLYASYFVTEDAEGPKELPVQNSYSGATTTVTSFDDYMAHERDSISLLHSGRELFGESFLSKTSQSFPFSAPGILSEPAQVRLSFAAAPKTVTPVVLSTGTDELLRLDVRPVGSEQKAVLVNGIKSWTPAATDNVTLNVSYNSAGQSVAYLNYISLNVKRKLQFYNEAYTFFRNKDSRNTALNYTIANASAGLQVWNVGDGHNIRQVQTALNGTTMSFGANTTGSVAEYVLVDVNGKSFRKPEVVQGTVKNQNLHALPQTDMVIIAPEAYLALAEKLAEKHRSVQGLKVTVVQPEWIYNEFSSGTPDATAYRRFMKMFYDRATTENEKPRYLLLYGDGYFNNRIINPKTTLLTYQFVESLSEAGSYGTDDYFGFLDDNEGIESALGSNKLDLGIGRFTVSTYNEAQNVMNKVINYMDNNRYSAWKNTVIFTADDTDPLFGFCKFAEWADELATIVEKDHPQYKVVKSYMDAFQPKDLNGKRTYPDARQKLMDTFKEGCFLMNYTGHGSPSSMSAKDMMNIITIRQMTFDNLPLWITATCDFGKFDDDRASAGEEVFLNRKSAGIALFTTTRVVGGAPNQTLNLSLIRNLFTKTEENKHPALGDIIRKSKTEISGSNKLNFILIGDPALQLNYPEWNVKLESINNQAVDGNKIINLKSLEEITLQGMVTDPSGNIAGDFSGTLQLTVFDGQQKIQSVTTNSDNEHWSFSDYPNIIYKGNTKVENGRFTVLFKVPTDISYATRTGKMNFYAWDAGKKTDASGSFENFTLFGMVDNPDMNELGPEIKKMFLNTEAFKDGDSVNETPFFYAEVFDEDGINRTGSGLGHGITISIDNKKAWTYPLDNYFQSGDVAGSGSVEFSIPELPEGRHQLVFKVWDILNNSTTDSLYFNVVKGLKPEVYALHASPNPVKTGVTRFYLEHNRPESILEVEIRVYDLTGRAVWSHVESGSSDYSQSYEVEWDLKSNGSKVAPGIYIYQAVIKTAQGKEATKSKKIIVL